MIAVLWSVRDENIFSIDALQGIEAGTEPTEVCTDINLVAHDVLLAFYVHKLYLLIPECEGNFLLHALGRGFMIEDLILVVLREGDIIEPQTFIFKLLV